MASRPACCTIVITSACSASRSVPYVVPGDPTSGVLPRISTASPGEYGAGRQEGPGVLLSLLRHGSSRESHPVREARGLRSAQYELLLRIYETGWRETFDKFDPVPNRKTDSNNHGPISTDNIGLNYDYPEASYERRREILKEHEIYQKGWLYFIANDPRVPKDVQERMRQWGLAKDEFTDNGGWPHQIYVREARRMVGEFVMTENELMKRRPTPIRSAWAPTPSIRTTCSATSRRKATSRTRATSACRFPARTRSPMARSCRKRGQADNLIVPVCLSSTHIAFGSIRMEPVFMVLAQSAATAAAIAIDRGVGVQDVPYAELQGAAAQGWAGAGIRPPAK